MGDYTGTIRIRVRYDQLGDAYLEVEDDGIGMSERVLTGPLLDFGTSFWSSNLVQDEFPGLRSSSFQSVGRFGIGFYSVFMISSSVTVSTRRWDAGLDNLRTLSFPRGLTLRPSLSGKRPEGFSAYASTKVCCRLKAEVGNLTTIEVKRNRLGDTNFNVTLAEYLAPLVAGLDVGVEYNDSDGNGAVVVHLPIATVKTLPARNEWLENISFAKYSEDPTMKTMVGSYAERLRFLSDGEQIVGLAALSTHLGNAADFLSIDTVGGLASSGHGRDSQRFVGYLDHDPSSAKREISASFRASANALQTWADEQVQMLSASNIAPLEWCAATCSLCDLGLDPLAIARVAIAYPDGQIRVVSIPEVIELAKSVGLAIFASGLLRHVETYHTAIVYESFPTFRPIRNSGFLSLEFVDDAPKDRCSFIGCLYRYANGASYRVKVERRSNIARTLIGPVDVLLITVE
jgi:hypothetical protein